MNRLIAFFLLLMTLPLFGQQTVGVNPQTGAIVSPPAALDSPNGIITNIIAGSSLSRSGATVTIPSSGTGGSGIQTPWTNNIDGGGFSLFDVDAITAALGDFTNGVTTPILTVSNGVPGTASNSITSSSIAMTNGGTNVFTVDTNTGATFGALVTAPNIDSTNLTMSPHGAITWPAFGMFIGTSNTSLVFSGGNNVFTFGSSPGATDGSILAFNFIGGTFHGSADQLTNIHSTNIAFSFNTNQITYLQLYDGVGNQGTLGNTNLIPNFGTNIQDVSFLNDLCFSNAFNLGSNFNWITYYLRVTNASATYHLSFDKMVAGINLLGGLTNGFLVTNGVWTLEVYCTGTNILNERWYLVGPNGAGGASGGASPTFSGQFIYNAGNGTNFVGPTTNEFAYNITLVGTNTNSLSFITNTYSIQTNSGVNWTNYTTNLTGNMTSIIGGVTIWSGPTGVTNSRGWIGSPTSTVSGQSAIFSNITAAIGIIGNLSGATNLSYTNLSYVTVTNRLVAPLNFVNGSGTTTGGDALLTNWNVSFGTNRQWSLITNSICISNCVGLVSNQWNFVELYLFTTNAANVGPVYFSVAGLATPIGFNNGIELPQQAAGLITVTNYTIITGRIYSTNWNDPTAIWTFNTPGNNAVYSSASGTHTLGSTGATNSLDEIIESQNGILKLINATSSGSVIRFYLNGTSSGNITAQFSDQENQSPGKAFRLNTAYLDMFLHGITNALFLDVKGTASISNGISQYGKSTDNSLSTVSTNGFYQTVGTAWTNGPQRGFFTIPYSWLTGSGTGWNAVCFVTNYSGVVGAAGTITNVTSTAAGQGGLTALVESGSNYFSGFVYSNSVINVIQNVGTIVALNTTNDQSNINWQ